MQNISLFVCCLLLCQMLTSAFAWKSKECPIDSQDNRDAFMCIRHCDYEESNSSPSRTQHGKEANKDNFFIFFFPSKGKEYEANRLKCPSGFKQVSENNQCFCERPLTPYELETQRREFCNQAFENCRMYGSQPTDCNNIIDVCPPVLIRDYCLAGKVFKMRFSTVVYQFCHAFLRLPNDGRRHFIDPDVDYKAKY